MSAYDIRDLFADLPEEISLKRDDAPVLSESEVEILERHANAGQNTFGAAMMGMHVVQEYLYLSSQEEPRSGIDLNMTSALLGLLTDVAEKAGEAEGAAKFHLLRHYKSLAEARASAKRGAK